MACLHPEEFVVPRKPSSRSSGEGGRRERRADVSSLALKNMGRIGARIFNYGTSVRCVSELYSLLINVLLTQEISYFLLLSLSCCDTIVPDVLSRRRINLQSFEFGSVKYYEIISHVFDFYIISPTKARELRKLIPLLCACSFRNMTRF